MNDLDWKQPALIGGLIVGLLSTIPGISLVNCCFCAWPLIGGIVAAKMLITRSPRPIKSGEGALVGLIAGLIGGGIYIGLSIPLLFIGITEKFQARLFDMMRERSSDPQVQEMMSKMIDALEHQTPTQKLIASLPFLIIIAVLYGGFTVLGGLLGVALFEKRKEQFPPPQYPSQPPPNYPPPGGGYGGGPGNWPQS